MSVYSFIVVSHPHDTQNNNKRSYFPPVFILPESFCTVIDDFIFWFECLFRGIDLKLSTFIVQITATVDVLLMIEYFTLFSV